MCRRIELLLVILALLFSPLAFPAHARPDEGTALQSGGKADSTEFRPSKKPNLRNSRKSKAPFLEKSLVTDHFILRWTNKSRHAADNIADPAIIHETGLYLEAAREKYYSLFGRAPYVPPGKKKIEVAFHDIDGYGIASPPDGPIRLDSESWVKKPGIRQPTSAHELFHKLQYAFGYRTKWKHKDQFEWFSEGTAAWAEVFIWQRVSGAYKVRELFKKPDYNLYETECNSLPFWLFLETRHRQTPDYNPLVDFFWTYEAIGDPKEALSRVVKRNLQIVDADGTLNDESCRLPDFFALFARERTPEFRRHTLPGNDSYSEILDPYGKNIIPSLTVTELRMESGDNYFKSESVSQLGSDYYRFKLADNTAGQTITVRVNGKRGSTYSYYLGWEKNGTRNQEPLLSGVAGDCGISERIDPEKADSLMLIVSGREKGATYSIDASIN